MSKRLFYASAGFLIIVVILMVIYFVLPGSEESPAKQKTKSGRGSQEVNLLFLGGSYTSAGDWRGYLSRRDVSKCANVSFRKNQLKFTLDKCVWEKTPKLCFINGGHEDIIARMPLKSLLDNYKWVVRQLMKKDVKPVVLSTIRIPEIGENVNSTIDLLNENLKEMADSMEVDFINITDLLCDENGLLEKYVTEGVKLNEEGYAVWAEVIKAYLNENPIWRK